MKRHHEGTSHPLARRRVLGALTLGALACVAPGVRAQAYPDRPVKLMIGYTPGGAGDAIARMIAQRYSQALSQPVLVDNRPGGNATLAAAAVAKAAGDGYTLLVSTGQDSVMAPLTMPQLPYSVTKDFVPISLVATVPSVLVVLASSPYQSVADVVKAARARPGTLNYGSYGNGSLAHMSAELFKHLSGAEVVQIAFKGSAPAMTELLAGRIDFMFDTFVSAWPQVQAGKLRALGVSADTRVQMAPQVPTMQEAGVPGYVFQSFFGLSAPVQTPREVVERLQKEAGRILAHPEIQKRLMDMGMVPAPADAENYGTFLARETERNRKLIRDAKLRFES